MKRYVIFGTHTGVGKTVVAAILTETLGGYYWKPVQCGLPTDRNWVNRTLSLKDRCYAESFCLHGPYSPHLAAQMEGIQIAAKDLILPLCPGPLIIEGTGGLLSPLNDVESWVDAGATWEADWILVHRPYLGSLNHFLLTVEALQHRKLPLLGVVFNGEGEAHTEKMLLKRASTRCLGRVAWQTALTPAVIQKMGREWKKNFS
jgi:dethiobiotin synthetase